MLRPYTFVIFAFFACPALGENISGNELLEVCEASDSEAQLGYCVGYVSGVIEGMKWGIASPLLRAGTSTDEVEELSNSLLGFCIPAEATLGQMRDVIMLYLRSNPADRHASARIQVQLALSEAYPCAGE